MLRTMARIVFAAATIGAGAFVALPLAQAAPSCTVNGEYLRLKQSEGPYVTTTTINANGSTLGPGVVTVPPSGTNGTYGTATGTIDGRNISVHIVWNDNKGTADFIGTIGDDGIARGNSMGTPIPVNLWNPGPWESSEPLNCPAAEQAQQKLGPTVTFEAALGGLVVHITDRSGVTSQCTYTADNGFTRSFGLNANSTFDLKIIPAVPEFRNWEVTVTCDNGTSTTVTQFF